MAATRCSHRCCGGKVTKRHCGEDHPTCTWRKCADCRWISDDQGRAMPDIKDRGSACDGFHPPQG